MKKPGWEFTRNRSVILLVIALTVSVLAFRTTTRDIPVTWDISELKASHIPPPDPSVHVEYAPKSYYDSIPEHVIYKTYPVYTVDAQPPGYLDSLRTLDPVITFDPDNLETQEDWVNAGEDVFFWPANFSSADRFQGFLDSTYFARTDDHHTKDGVYPYYRYVVKEKGTVLLGNLSCANCHTRVMDDGSLVIGAQGNHAFDPNFGYFVESIPDFPISVANNGFFMLAGTPLMPDALELSMSRERDRMIALLYAPPSGVMSRQGMRLDIPIRVPSLIGVKDIKYLDHTGLMLNRGPGDIMRYAALNQGMDMLTSHNGYIPMGVNDFSELPAMRDWDHPFGYEAYKYTDEQLYALTQFIYSLEPPKNPNTFPESQLQRGERVFIENGCVTCHTPTLYTNNMLTPVDGFEPPDEHFEQYNIFNVSVETDPRSALQSRRGTGYYKIPSLLGVWYRGPFFHNGELATLEDVMDPARLKDDYVPTGFKDPDIETKAVKGHDFGMDLSSEDKAALIAFLKSL